MRMSSLVCLLVISWLGWGVEAAAARGASPVAPARHVPVFPIDHWQCGHDDDTRSISYNQVLGCESSMEHLNHCCVVHDDCYSRQLGQEKCDTDFCNCNKAVLSVNKTAHDACFFYELGACWSTTAFGHEAYGASVGYKEPEDIARLPLVGAFSGLYDKVYAACHGAVSMLSSCANLFNRCETRHGRHGLCVELFLDCVDNVTRIHDESTCTELSAQFQKDFELDFARELRGGEWQWFVYLGHNNFSTFIFISLGVVCTITLLFFVWRTWQVRRVENKQNKSRKFTNVTTFNGQSEIMLT